TPPGKTLSQSRLGGGDGPARLLDPVGRGHTDREVNAPEGLERGLNLRGERGLHRHAGLRGGQGTSPWSPRGGPGRRPVSGYGETIRSWPPASMAGAGTERAAPPCN